MILRLKNEEPPTLCTLEDLKRILTNDRQQFKYRLYFSNSANPAENRYEMSPGLVNRKVHFDDAGPDSSFYDERVNVMWQEKTWADICFFAIP